MADHAHTYIPAIVEDQVAHRAAWYLSVCDLDQPPDGEFQGVFITTERDLAAASQLAWCAVGLGDNIQIAAFPYPQQDLDQVSHADRERLLAKDDLARIGENTRSAGEKGLW